MFTDTTKILAGNDCKWVISKCFLIIATGVSNTYNQLVDLISMRAFIMDNYINDNPSRKEPAKDNDLNIFMLLIGTDLYSFDRVAKRSLYRQFLSFPLPFLGWLSLVVSYNVYLKFLFALFYLTFSFFPSFLSFMKRIMEGALKHCPA